MRARGFRALFVAVLALLVANGCIARSVIVSTELPAGAREVRDVAYYAGTDFDEQKHRLNLFVPAGEGPHPVVVFVHGGGWFFGDRVELTDPYSRLGRRLASHGILSVIVSYRLSPKHKHPAHIEDVARAIAWTQSNIPSYGGDPSAIFLMGHSAGAQLVSLAACDPRWLRPHGLRPSQIAGVIAISAPFDVANLGRLPGTGIALVQPAFGPSRETWSAVSPSTHLGRSTPPRFLIAWADGDFETSTLLHHWRLWTASPRGDRPPKAPSWPQETSASRPASIAAALQEPAWAPRGRKGGSASVSVNELSTRLRVSHRCRLDLVVGVPLGGLVD